MFLDQGCFECIENIIAVQTEKGYGVERVCDSRVCYVDIESPQCMSKFNDIFFKRLHC